MTRLAILLFLVFSAPLQAQEIDVSTGEHDGFTRMVLRVPEGATWQLGRTENGYALVVDPNSGSFDLSRAFDRISTDRIAALRPVRPGRLDIDVACQCHAMPFEFRPDLLVVDIRDGAPPPGSIFELGMEGAPLRPITDRFPAVDSAVSDTPVTEMNWTRDWLASPLRTLPTMSQPPLGPDPMKDLVDLEQMRASLLKEFSRAAADGMIDPVHRPSVTMPLPTVAGTGATNMRISEPMVARPVTRAAPPVASDGRICPGDDVLSIEAWGIGGAADRQLAEAGAGLLGEFDAPDPQAVLSYARLNLHFGFGAEALQVLAAFPTEDPDEPLLRSMAMLVDGFPDPSGPFAAYAACDGPAALWAALSDPARLSPDLDRAAALRTFSQLPPHLRRSLGPTLAEIFFAADDVAAATDVVESILRLGEPDERLSILMARLELVTGGLASAEARLQAILSDPGPDQVSALIALVDLHAADNRPLDPRVTEALAAYRLETDGTALWISLNRAYPVALALSGDVSQAMTEASDNRDVLSEVWNIVAEGPDDGILIHTIGADPAQADPKDRARISDRLRLLGFPREAQLWANDPATLSVQEAPDDPLRSALRSRDWADLPAEMPPAWVDAADTLRPSNPDGPPLAEATALVDQSAATRARIADLLGTVPLP